MAKVSGYASWYFIVSLLLNSGKSRAGWVPNITWPIDYVDNFGSILDAIHCPTVLVLSFNSYYSHDNLFEKRISQKTVVVQRGLIAKKQLQPSYKFLESPPVRINLNISKFDYIIETDEVFSPLANLEPLFSPHMKCIHAIVVAPKHAISTRVLGERFWFFTFIKAMKQMFYIAMGYKHIVQVTMLEISQVLTDPMGTNRSLFEYQVYLKQYMSVTMDLGMLLCVPVSKGWFRLIPHTSRCIQSFFCWDCLPRPRMIYSFENIIVRNILDYTTYPNIIKNLIAYEKIELWHHSRDFIQTASTSSTDVCKNPLSIASKRLVQNSILVLKLISCSLSKNITIKGPENDPGVPQVHVDEPLRYAFLSFSENRIKHVASGSSSYNFITCFRQKSLSFQFFIQPFQFGLWTGVFCSILVLLFFAPNFFVFHRKTSKTSFSPLIYMWQVLLENGPDLPKEISKHISVKILVAAWLYLALHITNGYKGIITTSTIAAPPQTTKYRTFSDFQCSFNMSYSECPKLYGSISHRLTSAWISHSFSLESVQLTEFCKQNDLLNFCHNHLLSAIELVQHNKYDNILFDTLVYMNLPWLFAPYRILKQNHYAKSGKNFSGRLFLNALQNQNMRMLSNMDYYWVPRRVNGKQSRLTYRAALEAETLQCSERKVLVLDSEEIVNEFEYLSKNYPTKTFFKGTSTFLHSPTTWMFSKARYMKLSDIFLRFMESGVYQAIKQIGHDWSRSSARFSYTRNSTEYGRFVNPLSLSSNIICVFIVWGIAVAFACVVFLLYKMSNILRNPMSWYGKLKTGFKRKCLEVCNRLLESVIT